LILTNVPLPVSLAIIDPGAFNGCTALANVTIPDSVNTIGASAYGACTSLTNVVIGSGVTNFGTTVFQGCTKLRTVTIGAPSIGNWFAGLPLISVTILNSVTNIGANAFASLSSITNLVIGNGVMSIGNGAFTNCSGLGHVVIPASVSSIGSDAFYNCSGLNWIFFLGDVPSVGASAFDGVFATVYYLPYAAGWSSPFYGMTAYLWNPQPVMDDGNFGVRTNRFGFNITGTPGLIIMVEGSTNLVDWKPVQARLLSAGSAYFGDSQWTNYPARLYRIRPYP
jgi:hypothetical protein